MAPDQDPTEQTLADFTAMLRTEGMSDERARDLANGLTDGELRMLMDDQRAAEPDEHLLARLVRARHDPRLLAATLPRARSAETGGVVAVMAVGILLVAWVLAMPIALAGPAVGAAIDAAALVIYIAILRPLAKHSGVMSTGCFTVDRNGEFRVLAGIGQARRRLAFGGNDLGPRATFGTAAIVLAVVIGVPVALVAVTGTPALMLGWMIFAMLAIGELPVLALRTHMDTRRRQAVVIDPQFGLSITAYALAEGGDVAAAVDGGVSLDRMVPSDEDTFRRVMVEALTRRAMTSR